MSLLMEIRKRKKTEVAMFVSDPLGRRMVKLGVEMEMETML